MTVPVSPGVAVNRDQLCLATAKPGNTRWTVLSGATYANGASSVPVAGFSYFRVVQITNLSVPKPDAAAGQQPGRREPRRGPLATR